MREWLIGAALCAATLASPALAEVTPAAGRHDSRVRNAVYQDGQVYRVNVGMMRVTSVEFGPGEEITSIVAGDTEGFNFDGVPGGRALVVKPTVPGGSTNMTVYTNRRAYYLHLQEAGQRADYVVRFDGGVVAQAPRTAAAEPQNKQLNPTREWHGYAASERNAALPSHVWDDGDFTYFRFPRSAQLPAIFKTSNGPERTVNSTTLPDGTIRVSGLSPYWVLRISATETVIKRLDPRS
ncbi:TrbG/VirB9 family P-type conjugative transfer protein [Paracoccus tibetensis]|uniref:Type IV secretion system protein VirB9 n=1 Tax=Paracoccus tibetensis TaxID=336292 RepID=A0A1G5JP24_9RHOB|nr:TrbG/VirB9 family P-type conjugative transfer protein [Paracoccus tibetensis]SCY90077.1 type IV secretion system protein VirB9 [Paracoccus tibetensis]